MTIRAGSDVLGIIQTLTMCTSPGYAGTYIRNDSSSLVWVVDEPAFEWPGPEHDKLKAFLFRSAVADQIAGLELEPKSWVILKETSPGTVHVNTDRDAQAAWETVSELVDQGVDAGGEYAVQQLSRNSPARRAVLTCAVSAFKIGDAAYEAADEPARELVDQLGFGADQASSVAGCATSVRDAERAEPGKPVLRLEASKARFSTSSWLAKSGQSLKQAGIRVGRVIFS